MLKTCRIAADIACDSEGPSPSCSLDIGPDNVTCLVDYDGPILWWLFEVVVGGWLLVV